MNKVITNNLDGRPLLLKRITEEAIYLRPKEKGAREEIDETGEGVHPWIRIATKDDAKLVESWMGSTSQDKSTEFHWLGGKTGDGTSSLKDQVESWISSPYGAFVLFFSKGRQGESSKPFQTKHQVPVAFMNIDDFPEVPTELSRNLEVGRLIVRPEYRRRGYGSTLMRHITRVLGESGFSLSIHARVLEDNRVAQAMLYKLPFAKSDIAPYYERDPSHKCVFFKYRLARRGSRLGEHVARLRKERNLNQAQAAFLCGIAPSMINMIESGRRYPSFGKLQDLTSILAEGQFDKVKLLLSAVGEQLDPTIEDAVSATRPISQEASPDSQKANFWIFSDRFLEDIDNNVFNSSLDAIRSDFHRWYFAPPGYWESQGTMLAERFKTAQLRDGTSLRVDEINRHLRFYKAPAALCSLRIAIRVPNLENAASGAGPVETTIGGKQAARFGVENERSTALMASVLKVVRNLESLAGRTLYPELEGFALLFPRTDNKQVKQKHGP